MIVNCPVASLLDSMEENCYLSIYNITFFQSPQAPSLIFAVGYIEACVGDRMTSQHLFELTEFCQTNDRILQAIPLRPRCHTD